MELVGAPPAECGSPNVREMTRWEKVKSQIKWRYIRLRRKLPYLVWYGDEIDVGVTLIEHKLDVSDPSQPFKSLYSGRAAEATDAMRRLGIGFDTGCGAGGYDWEWDYSLRGPISVRFRSRAERPHLRKSAPVPELVVDNTAA